MTIKRSTHVLFLLILFTGFTGLVFAKEKNASLSTQVDAAAVHTTKLGNLPKAASVSIKVKVDGKINILLLNQSDFKRFPSSQAPLFSSTTADNIGFNVKIPETGHYYLVIDNRAGKEPRSISIDIKASNNAGNDTAAAKQIETVLEKFEQNLKQYFVFDNLNFRVGRCGTANAFSRDDTVILCAEIAPKLMNTIGDKTKAQDALMFAIMHEIGHVLLKQWGYPFYDNEELADEFATALLVMFKQGHRARSQAEYFSRMPTEEELQKKQHLNDKHPLSVQRARNILGWLQEPDLVKRWQKVLVPNMQTRVLKALQRNPKTWTDKKLIQQELAKRK